MRGAAFLLFLLLAVGGCQSSPDESNAQHEYRAWCANEGKFLTEWDADRSVAENARAAHQKTWPHHQVTIRTR